MNEIPAIAEYNNRVMKARAFAAGAHAGQLYGIEPYTKHLDMVVQVLIDFELTESATLCIGYLHDVIEDTRVTKGDLEREFGTEIAANVDLVSDRRDLPNRKARKADLYRRMKKVKEATTDRPWKALAVKAADRYANVKTCIATRNRGLLAMYKKEHAEFRVAVQRDWDGLEELWAELDELLTGGE